MDQSGKQTDAIELRLQKMEILSQRGDWPNDDIGCCTLTFSGASSRICWWVLIQFVRQQPYL